MKLSDCEDGFARWAFGETYDKYINEGCTGIELMEAWNRNQGHLCRLKPEGLLSDDLQSMYEFYKKQQEEKQ